MYENYIFAIEMKTGHHIYQLVSPLKHFTANLVLKHL